MRGDFGSDDTDSLDAPPPLVYPGDVAAQRLPWPLDAEISLQHKLWLQLIQELLEEPLSRQVGFPPWRGVVGSIRDLQRLTHLAEDKLKAKRETANQARNPSLITIEECVEAIAAKSVCGHILKRVKESWISPTTGNINSLSSTLWFTFAQRVALWKDLVAEIREFLLSPLKPEDVWKKWPNIETLSRGIFLDVLEMGDLVPEDLRCLSLNPEESTLAANAVNAWLGLFEGVTTESPLRCEYELSLKLTSPPGDWSAYKEPVKLSLTGISIQVKTVERVSDASHETPGELIALQDVDDGSVRYIISGTVSGHTHPQLTRLLETYLPRVLNLRDENQGKGWQVLDVQLFPSVETHVPADEEYVVHNTLGSLRSRPSLESQRHSLPDFQAELTVVGLQERCRRAKSMLMLMYDQRPIEQLARSWSSLEQVVSAGQTNKGLDTIRSAQPLLALNHLLHVARQLHADIRFALSIALLFATSLDNQKRSCGEIWLGTEGMEAIHRQRMSAPQAQKGWLARDGRSANPFEAPNLSGEGALRHLTTCRHELKSLQELLTPYFPRLSYRLTQLFDLFGYDVRTGQPRKGREDRRSSLERLKERIAAFLWFIYELRNQYVHELEHSHRDGAHRIQRYVSPLHSLLVGVLDSTERRLQVLGEGVPSAMVWESFGEQFALLRDIPDELLLDALPQIFRDCSDTLF